MMSCARAGQLLEGQINQDLSWTGLLELRAHLVICSICRTYRRQALEIRRLVRTAQRPDQTLKMPEIVKTRIARRIAEATELGP
ncbi:hypothetical protein IV102_30330 [bacterium]|nr:hypothetical protein [bacterium]